MAEKKIVVGRDMETVLKQASEEASKKKKPVKK
jgi:hypothetical protein